MSKSDFLSLVETNLVWFVSLQQQSGGAPGPEMGWSILEELNTIRLNWKESSDESHDQGPSLPVLLVSQKCPVSRLHRDVSTQ